MNEIYVNGVDQIVGNICTYAIGLYSEKAGKMAYKWFLEKFNEKAVVVRKPMKMVVTELNPKLISQIGKAAPDAKVIVSHYSVINEFKKIIDK